MPSVVLASGYHNTSAHRRGGGRWDEGNPHSRGAE